MNEACQIIHNTKRFADTIYNTCIIKVVPGCSRSWASTIWKWGPLPGSSLITMKALHVWKIYITTEVFCSTNSMVHVTKRTRRRRGACFPYPRRTWWAPPHSELLVTRQIYIHFQRAQPHSAVAAWGRRTWRPCKAWATGAKGRQVRTCPDKRLRLLPSVLPL